MRRVLAVLLALTAACGCSSPAPMIAKPTSTAKPKLVVLIVIDQWPSWVFSRDREHFTGGIARLLREGAVVPAAEIPHAATFTAVGHATIGTGAPPRVHGIQGNYWYRRDEGRDRPAEYDPDAIPFSVGDGWGAPVDQDDGASARALRVDGIADVLRAETGGAAKSVAIALKARSACLVAGRQPDLAIWYEPGAGGMTTSAAYAKHVPVWIVDAVKTSSPSRFFGSTWTPRDPALLARVTKLPDDVVGEASNHGFDATFPHSLSELKKPEYAIQETPFADEMVALTVTAALDAMELGRDDVPDFVAISFGAHDLAGHGWGPDSWEVLDLTLRLDGLLGELFATLDARVGFNGWAAIVTSDHGATPVPERASSGSTHRVSPGDIERAAEKAIEESVKQPGPWVAKLTASNLYMTKKLAELPDDVRARALDAAANAVARVPGIAIAGRTDVLSADCSVETGLGLAACNARVPGAAGELYVYTARGSVVTDIKFGTGHDAPDADNREIPILVRAPGLARQEGQGTQLQIAPTIVALLGLAQPATMSEPPLFGIERR